MPLQISTKENIRKHLENVSLKDKVNSLIFLFNHYINLFTKIYEIYYIINLLHKLFITYIVYII